MLAPALARCFDDLPVSAVLIEPLASDIRAHRFYERLEFRFLEWRRFGDDQCFVYRLDRADYMQAADICKQRAGRGNVTVQQPHEIYPQEKP